MFAFTFACDLDCLFLMSFKQNTCLKQVLPLKKLIRHEIRFNRLKTLYKKP
jgi:hypothetical protein